MRYWIEVAHSGLRGLPASVWGTHVRWHGVHVTTEIAFHPETLTIGQVLSEPNAEVRRIMVERIGLERFFREAAVTVLDQDTDAGGVRRLLRIAIPDDEAYVALEVNDPSTERQYFLRVPQHVQLCRQAAAWIAGFDNPDDYAPLVET